ncbi:Bcr/CflA family drug resistance efflux transporter [Adhaeribacter aerolatus]|uniref:Bcr/CflA family drug resistance efflux transporter n=1 Tax=Adhaeribacter aerolatus TaxID=670289 RepID=A0A512AWC3_9BACT|nr:multidrug effflux MFS transporter [Adhaeribacter aerolatus]GEO04019.1 Bcr/CflA family drug resistance efflux transporter [Adhaeribacter aerolatus]
MNRKQHFIIILILGALSTISPFSIDMYLPGFPAIAADLNTTIEQVQLSLTSYLIGIAAGQLLYGPLLDRYGRKMPLYAGMALYILSSLGCALTNSAETLILMRFLQAVGGCAGMVAAMALVRDLFPVSETAKVLSLLTLVIAVSPMIAPTLGAYVTATVGWHYVFLILAGIAALIVLGIYTSLPNGTKPDTSLSLRPRAVLANFYAVIKNPQFLIYTLAGGIGSAAPFAYISGSPDVFLNIYKVSEQEYGWIFAFLAAAMIGSTQVNTLLLRRFTSEQLIKIALTGQTMLGILLVLGTLGGWYGQYSLILLLFLFLCGQGLNVPNASALSLAPFAKNAGSASALMGSARMGMGALASAIVSLLHNGTVLPMVGVMAFCAITGLLILLAGRKIAAPMLENEVEPAEVREAAALGEAKF